MYNIFVGTGSGSSFEFTHALDYFLCCGLSCNSFCRLARSILYLVVLMTVAKILSESIPSLETSPQHSDLY